MNLTNKQIRSKARFLLDENVFGKDWLKSVLAHMVMLVIDGGVGSFLASLAAALVAALGTLIAIYVPGAGLPVFIVTYIIVFALSFMLTSGIAGIVNAGISSLHLDLVRNNDHISIRRVFDGFKNIGENFVLGLMTALNVLLWTFVFIIPGIYVSYSYALVFHVKKDHPDFTWRECLDESERLMEGNRWKLFKLNLSFIGWVFLSGLLFFGIGMLWITPYMQTSFAIFYDEVKRLKDTNVVSLDPSSKQKVDPIVVTPNNLGISLHREG